MVDAAGVDTWSVCWYLREGSRPHRVIEALATERGPRSRLVPGKVAGHRVGWFPASRMLFAEGHPRPDGLAGADDLPLALELVSEGLADLGLHPPDRRLTSIAVPTNEGLHTPLPVMGGSGFGGIRRLDSTVDLAFEKPAEGLAALAGVAALPLPRMKTQVIREVGGSRVETVDFRGSSGKRVLGRWYDKGVESGLAGRGRHVRPEDQRRYPKEARLDVEAVASSSYIRDAFVRRFEPLWRASKGVKVAGVIELAQRLGELVDEGELSAGQAKAIAGYLVLESADAYRQSRPQRYRDRAAARNHGLVLADGVLDEVDIDLGEIMERAMDSAAWGCEG